MPFPWIAAASLAGGAVEYFSAKAAARDQRKFEERMSNTSYQRAVKDLRKAGLNPALAYSQGGASTPNVGIADVPENVADRAVRSQREVTDSASARSLQRVQEGVGKSQAVKNAADAALAKDQAALARANTSRTLQETRLMGLNVPRAAAVADFWSQAHKLGTGLQSWLGNAEDWWKNQQAREERDGIRLRGRLRNSARELRRNLFMPPSWNPNEGLRVDRGNDRGNP